MNAAASFRSQRRNRCSSHLWHARCVDGLNISAARRDACCSLARRLLPVIGYQLHTARLLWTHGINSGIHIPRAVCTVGGKNGLERLIWPEKALHPKIFMLSNLMHRWNVSSKNTKTSSTQFHIILVGSMHCSLIHLGFYAYNFSLH